MEAILVIVGFLGAGKTTLLRKIVESYLKDSWNPYIILNDYENANIDAQSFLNLVNTNQINSLSGSCICCSGINELREQVNRIPKRDKGITLIEANGTTDAVSLMGFLGVGMNNNFLPPIQIAVVDVRLWQKRGQDNELEANQVKVSSMIVLNFIDQVDIERLVEVEQDLRSINHKAMLIHWGDFDINLLSNLAPNDNQTTKMDHHKAHWSSCSVDLPDPISSDSLTQIIDKIPQDILRVKGCTRIDSEENYTHFERTPNGDVFSRPYNGVPVTGPKILTIGPGSDPEILEEIIENSTSITS